MKLFSISHLTRAYLTALLFVTLLNGVLSAQQGTVSGTVSAVVTDPMTGEPNTLAMPNLFVRAAGKIASLYSWSLRTSPVGWTMGSEWEFGIPKGLGSNCFDPTAAATGSNVYGNNLLSGDYPVELAEPSYLTTAAIDCTGKTNVHLRFKRWLGIAGRDMNQDSATIEVSNDGDVWDLVWINPDSPICDDEWKTVVYDISETADNQNTVYIRWGLGPIANVEGPYCGWNIDDIELLTYNNGENTTITEADGSYEVGLPWVYNTISSKLEGSYCQVNYDYAATATEDPEFSQGDVQDGQTVDILWDDQVYGADIVAADAYWHINRLHDYLKEIDPSFTLMDDSIPVVISNGWASWDAESGIITLSTNSTPKEIYYNYTLAALDRIYAGLDVSADIEYPALRVAIANYFAISMTGGADSSPLRRDTEWSNMEERDAEILTNALLMAADQIGYDVMDQLVHFSRMDRPRSFDQMLDSLIIKDDQIFGDGLAANGSPHGEGIYTAFGASGMGGLCLVEGSLKIIDENGDNDGLLEPGETAMIQISLINGWADATDITAVLSSESEYLTISDDTIEFGNASYGVELNNQSDVFEVTLSEEASDTESIPLVISVTAAGPYEYSRDCLQQLAIGVDQFFYDDGQLDSMGFRMILYRNSPMAVRFTPVNYPFTIEGARLLPKFLPVEDELGFHSVMVTVWDDNGFDGGPGTELASKEVKLKLGDLDEWFDVDLTEFELQITEGSYYVGWSNVIRNETPQPVQYINHSDYDPPYYNRSYVYVDDVWRNFRSEGLLANLMVRLKGYSPGLFRLNTVSELYWTVGQPVNHILVTQNAVEPLHHWQILSGDSATDAWQDQAHLYEAAGEPQNWKADDAVWDLDLPFSFPFFGTSYDSVKVCSNGFLNFGDTNSHANNSFERLLANKRIAPLWDDLRTDGDNGDVFVDVSEPNQVMIRWQAITRSTAQACNFSVVLFSNGDIRFDYGSGNIELTPTVGISAGNNRDYYLSGGYDGMSDLENKMSILFRPGSVESAVPLPPGVVFDDQTGVLSGMPTQAGDYKVRFSVIDSKVPERMTSRRYIFHVVDSAPAFAEYFNGDATRFTVDNFFGDGNGLWHLSTGCVNGLAGHSSAQSLYYGSEASCDYNTGRSEGVVDFDPVTLLDAEKIVLNFKYYLHTEGTPEWDEASIEVAEVDKPFTVVAHNHPETLGDDVTKLIDFGVTNNGFRQTWIAGIVDLSQYAGSKIVIRLHFKTGDEGNNSFTGFAVDDMEIRYLESIPADWSVDNYFDLADFAFLSAAWGQENAGLYDLTGDGMVDMADLTVFVDQYWLGSLKYAGGSGSVSNPYRIRTADQLVAFMNTPADWSANVKLMDNIDMATVTDPESVVMIGSGKDQSFEGSFDGRGYTISNLMLPLFDRTSGAIIKNLTLADSQIDMDTGFVGALLGQDLGDTQILDCAVSGGTIMGIEAVGGLVGQLSETGTMTRCTSDATVLGQRLVGGLIGDCYGQIELSWSQAVVEAELGPAGGIAGGAHMNLFVNCYSQAQVTAAVVSGDPDQMPYTGGFVGYSEGAAFETCYSAATIDMEAQLADALVEDEAGNIDIDFSLVDKTITGVFIGSDGGEMPSIFLNGFWDNSLNYFDEYGAYPLRVIGNRAAPADLRGRNTQLMQTKSTFVEYEWDFVDTWAIQPGEYPSLVWAAQ